MEKQNDWSGKLVDASHPIAHDAVALLFSRKYRPIFDI